MSDESRLNPQVKKVDVGKRHLRTIHVYPLSLKEQLDMTQVIVEILNEFSDMGDLRSMSEEQVLHFMRDFLTRNLNQVLDLCVDRDEKPSFEELTNDQLVQIIDTIFTVNYEGLIKNFKDLFERGKGLFQAVPAKALDQ